MEKAYQQISYLFIALLAITLIGFFNSYLVLFPHFTGTTNVLHFHAFTLFLWIGLLIAQPLLIKFKKVEIHRLLGKMSYFLMPLVLFSMLLVTRSFIMRNIAENTPYELTYYFMYFTIPDLVTIPVLYLLAMWYRKKPSVHMRYIIACSVIFFNPAIGRIFILYGMDPVLAVLVTYLFCDLILLGFLIYDVVKNKPYKPYLYSLIFLAFWHSSLLYIPFSPWWQSTAEVLAQNFFQ